jgi:hypothetical protein
VVHHRFSSPVPIEEYRQADSSVVLLLTIRQLHGLFETGTEHMQIIIIKANDVKCFWVLSKKQLTYLDTLVIAR